MSCDDSVCGTGGWTGPKPGDPDNSVTLHANQVYGGINVSWTYPLVNPHAVAYTRVYRGTVNDLSKAIELARIGSSIYFDKLDPEVATAYYYWIQVTSINGTTNDPVGPASAIAKPLAEQTLESLTGRIDASLLEQTLKSDIGMGAEANAAILTEAQSRLLANQAFADLLAEVQSGVAQAATIVQNEITQRQDGDNALAQSIQLLAAANEQGAMAAVQEEKQARVTADSAMAQDIETLYGAIGDSSAGLIHDVNILSNRTDSTAQDILKLATAVGDSSSGLIHNVTTVSNATQSAAQDLLTLNATVNGNTASGQTGLVSKVDGITGALTDMWFAKVEANGLIGGFGIYNDGRSVLAGFDVDTFYVGRTGNAVKPFIVDNDTVYIDKARIRNADIDSLKIAGEAVTVPLVVTAPDKKRRGIGEGTWTVVNTAYMNMTEPGLVYILATTAQGFANNQRYWSFKLRVNGSDLRMIMGRQANDAPVMSLALPFNTGSNKVELVWSAHPDVILGYTELFLIGAKR